MSGVARGGFCYIVVSTSSNDACWTECDGIYADSSPLEIRNEVDNAFWCDFIKDHSDMATLGMLDYGSPNWQWQHDSDPVTWHAYEWSYPTPLPDGYDCAYLYGDDCSWVLVDSGQCSSTILDCICQVPLSDAPSCDSVPSLDVELVCCGNKGTCLSTDNCSCISGYCGSDCDLTPPSCGGLLVCTPPDCSSHGVCLVGECQCDPGWTQSADCSVIDPCNPPDCSGHGICEGNNCTCNSGWTQSADCSASDPCTPPGCSGHGFCDGGNCSCDSDWDTLPDCSTSPGGAGPLSPTTVITIAVTIPVLSAIILAVAAVVIVLICCFCPTVFTICACCACCTCCAEIAAARAGKGTPQHELLETDLKTPTKPKSNPKSKPKTKPTATSKGGGRSSSSSSDDDDSAEEDSSRASFRMHKKLLEIPYDSVRLVDSLGSGGGGATVFAAEWNGQRVAFKVFKTQHFNSDDLDFREFERELEIMASVSHPNLVRMFGCSLKAPRVGIVMELCQNGDLVDAVLKKVLPTLLGRLKVLRGVVSGMAYLHERSIIHRDLKPQNVLLDDLLVPKIMDFGLSRLKAENSRDMTTKIGTPAFMAPELVLSSHAGYDQSVDVYAFGILMWELVEQNFLPYEFLGAPAPITAKVATDPSCRPPLNEAKYGQKDASWMRELMEDAWSHEPSARPSFVDIGKRFDAGLEQVGTLQWPGEEKESDDGSSSSSD